MVEESMELFQKRVHQVTGLIERLKEENANLKGQIIKLEDENQSLKEQINNMRVDRDEIKKKIDDAILTFDALNIEDLEEELADEEAIEDKE